MNNFTRLLEKNYTRKGGNGEQVKWKITLNNGKKKTVKADSQKSAKDHLDTNELIIGVKSIVKDK